MASTMRFIEQQAKAGVALAQVQAQVAQAVAAGDAASGWTDAVVASKYALFTSVSQARVSAAKAPAKVAKAKPERIPVIVPSKLMRARVWVDGPNARGSFELITSAGSLGERGGVRYEAKLDGKAAGALVYTGKQAERLLAGEAVTVWVQDRAHTLTLRK